MYAVGGVRNDPSGPTDNLATALLERYAFWQDEWTSGTAMPTARTFFALAGNEVRVWAFGGGTRADPPHLTPSSAMTSLNQQYTFCTDTCIAHMDWHMHGMIVLMFSHEPGTTRMNQPSEQIGFGAASIHPLADSAGYFRILAAGGWVTDTQVVEEYAHETDNWQTKNSLPEGLKYHSMSRTDGAFAGHVYIVGDHDPGGEIMRRYLKSTDECGSSVDLN